VVERASFLSLKDWSFVTNSSETYHCCATYHSWLVGDTSSFGVVILGEGTSNKRSHFLNIISRIGPYML
jgi:hypothetical protein